MEKKETQDLYVFLKNKAIVFLSLREHSELDLSKKLLASARVFLSRSDADSISLLSGEISREIIPKLIQEIIQELVLKNYLSNQKYAESYIRSRAKKGYGPNYFRQALRQEGLGLNLINQVLEELENNHLNINFTEIALNILNKKFKNLDLSDYKTNQKARKFLYDRGFDLEIMKQVNLQ